MSNRITDAMLDHKVEHLNNITGNPTEQYTLVIGTGGKANHVSNPGCYYLDQAYGGTRLLRMLPDGEGSSDVFGCGFETKRNILDRISAMIIGYLAGHTRATDMALGIIETRNRVDDQV